MATAPTSKRLCKELPSVEDMEEDAGIGGEEDCTPKQADIAAAFQSKGTGNVATSYKVKWNATGKRKQLAALFPNGAADINAMFDKEALENNCSQ